MQSIRRVALRSVASAARAGAPKAPSSQFAGQFVAKNVVKPAAVSFARCFSQSVRRMNEDERSNIESQITGQPQESRETRQQQPRTDPPNGIWLRNFPFDIDESHMNELFQKFGTVVEARIVRDARGLSRGYGFVYMSSPEEANTAVAELNGSFWHGRRLHMERQSDQRKNSTAQKRPNTIPNEPTRYLYIGNIPYEATDAELNKMFRGLENLEDVRVAVDRVTGFPRGFAHADFTDVESAKKALEKLSGFDLGGRPLRIDYAGNSIDAKKSRAGGRPGRTGRSDRTGRTDRYERTDRTERTE